MHSNHLRYRVSFGSSAVPIMAFLFFVTISGCQEGSQPIVSGTITIPSEPELHFSISRSFYWYKMDGLDKQGIYVFSTNIDCSCEEASSGLLALGIFPQYNMVIYANNNGLGRYELNKTQPDQGWYFSGGLSYVESDTAYRSFDFESGWLEIDHLSEDSMSANIETTILGRFDETGELSGYIDSEYCVIEL